jgi:hypothetical protein
MSTNMAARLTVHFMKDTYVFFTFLVCAFGVRGIEDLSGNKRFFGILTNLPGLPGLFSATVTRLMTII